MFLTYFIATNFDGQFYGLRTGCTRWLWCLLQSPKQFFSVLRVFVQIVQNHKQQRFYGGPRTKSDDNAENAIYEKELTTTQYCLYRNLRIPKTQISTSYSNINISI